jgi:hypothetical protein
MNTLFVKALKKGFDMSKEDAAALAQTVQKHLLYLRREEVSEKGKFIRKYYWSYNTDGIRAEAYRRPIEESPYEIYKKIPEQAWLIHSANT